MSRGLDEAIALLEWWPEERLARQWQCVEENDDGTISVCPAYVLAWGYLGRQPEIGTTPWDWDEVRARFSLGEGMITRIMQVYDRAKNPEDGRALVLALLRRIKQGGAV